MAATERWYPILADVIALHVRMMHELGENPAPLMAGGQEKLESAIARPAWASVHGQADLAEQAALLAIGIAQAHAFVDNNKRLAYIVSVAFLRMNGQPLPAEHSFTFGKHIEDVLAHTMTVEDVGDWLRRVVEPGER